MKRTVLLVAGLMVLGACQSTNGLSHKLYPGPVRPASELAIVRFGNAYVVRIDGLIATRADWTDVCLLPGEHTIWWATDLPGDPFLHILGEGKAELKGVFNLMPSHVYELRFHRTAGHVYLVHPQLDDLTAGDIAIPVAKP